MGCSQFVTADTLLVSIWIWGLTRLLASSVLGAASGPGLHVEYFLPSVGDYQNIVLIHKPKLSLLLKKHIIDQSLGNYWSICRAIGHYQIFTATCEAVKGCVTLITLMDTNQVMGVSEIYLSENSKRGF